MPFIIWNSTFSVGISEMDSQHKEMIGIINDLYEASCMGKGDLELTRILKELIDYSHHHFSSEETLLSTAGYPRYYQQKKEHDLYVQKMLEYQSNYQVGKTSLSLEVFQFLKRWWTQHIQGEDQLYTEFIQNYRRKLAQKS